MKDTKNGAGTKTRTTQRRAPAACVTLTLNEKQAEVVADALDFHSRLGMCQFGEISSECIHAGVKGADGKPFTFYKIRSMRNDCERESGPKWSTTGDDRVTPIGKFLRKSHIDELPQIINVLKGDMSLVGPRPLLHAFGLLRVRGAGAVAADAVGRARVGRIGHRAAAHGQRGGVHRRLLLRHVTVRTLAHVGQVVRVVAFHAGLGGLDVRQRPGRGDQPAQAEQQRSQGGQRAHAQFWPCTMSTPLKPPLEWQSAQISCVTIEADCVRLPNEALPMLSFKIDSIIRPGMMKAP